LFELVGTEIIDQLLVHMKHSVEDYFACCSDYTVPTVVELSKVGNCSSRKFSAL